MFKSELSSDYGWSVKLRSRGGPYHIFEITDRLILSFLVADSPWPTSIKHPDGCRVDDYISRFGSALVVFKDGKLYAQITPSLTDVRNISNERFVPERPLLDLIVGAIDHIAPYAALDFARSYLKCAWSAHPDVDPETAAIAERALAENAYAAMEYAECLLKSAFCTHPGVNPEVAKVVESAIADDAKCAVDYAQYFLGCAWSAHPKVDKETAKQAEETIACWKVYSMKYARDVLKGPWCSSQTVDKGTAKEAEMNIAGDLYYNLQYASSILKCKWSECTNIDPEVVKLAEATIKKNSTAVEQYEKMFTGSKEQQGCSATSSRKKYNIKVHNASYLIARELGHAWTNYARMGDDGFAIIDWDTRDDAQVEDGGLGKHWTPTNADVSDTWRIVWKVDSDACDPGSAYVKIEIVRPASVIGAVERSFAVLRLTFTVRPNGQISQIFSFEKAEDWLVRDRHWFALADLLKSAFGKDLREVDRLINGPKTPQK